MDIKKLFIKHTKKIFFFALTVVATIIITKITEIYISNNEGIKYFFANISEEYETDLSLSGTYISKLTLENSSKEPIENITINLNHPILNLEIENEHFNYNINENGAIIIPRLFVNDKIVFVIRTNKLLTHNDVLIKQPFGKVIYDSKYNHVGIVFILLIAILLAFFIYLFFWGYKIKAYQLADKTIKKHTYYFESEIKMDLGDEKEIIFPDTNGRKIKIQYIENEINNDFKISIVYLNIDASGDTYMTREISYDDYQFKILCNNDIYYDKKYVMFFESHELESLDITHICPRHVNLQTKELSLKIKYWRLYPYHYWH
jgi:hypothetical protein